MTYPVTNTDNILSWVLPKWSNATDNQPTNKTAN